MNYVSILTRIIDWCNSEAFSAPFDFIKFKNVIELYWGLPLILFFFCFLFFFCIPFNRFHVSCLFLYPLKTSTCFQGGAEKDQWHKMCNRNISSSNSSRELDFNRNRFYQNHLNYFKVLAFTKGHKFAPTTDLLSKCLPHGSQRDVCT